MSCQIERRETKYRLSCVCCGASVRTCEKYLQVVDYAGNPVRGERYCVHCEEEARENNDIDDDGHNAERNAEREREIFAAYKAAGATHVYFEDMDHGLI